MSDGSTVEEYFWEGALHRVDGPAMVRRNADGSWIEQYYRVGKLHRVDGPAIIWRKPDGSMSHAYYRDDERYQRLLGWAGDGLGVSSDGAGKGLQEQRFVKPPARRFVRIGSLRDNSVLTGSSVL